MEKWFSDEERDYLKVLLEDKGRRIILYHSDPDGVCSAAMVAKLFPGAEFIPRKGPGITDDFLKVLIEKKPDVLVALDIPLDQEFRAIRSLRKEVPGMRMAIIDHHIFERNMNPGILHVNPRFHKPGDYIPASCVVYRMLEAMKLEVKPLLWMAAAGVVGDMGEKWCGKLMREAKKEFPYLLKKGPRESKIMDAVETISATITMTGLKGAGTCLKALKEGDGFEDFAGNKKLSKLRKDFHEEFRFVTGGFQKEHIEHTKKVWSYEIKSAYSITSMVANYFGSKFPDRIIIIRKVNPQGWKFSVRGQKSKLNLGNLVKKSVKGIGTGGGHERASAGIVSDWDKFITRFVKNAK
jgi:single-stranded DNA-specific DHH superfamily exonuclease